MTPSLWVALHLLACNEPSGPPPDRTSPLIQILSPTAATYDKDGDGLVDFEITFTDSGSGIDPSSIRVIAPRGTMNGASDEDLVPLYHVVQKDSTRLVMEESFPRLLHDGENVLEVRVKDRRGNEAVATTTLQLPPGAYHTTFDLGIDPFNPGQAIVVLPDAPKGYVAFFTNQLAVFDPDSPRALKEVRVPSEFGFPELSDFAYDESSHLLYISSDNAPVIVVLDTQTDEVVAQIPIFDAASTLGLSRLTPELYAGLQVFGDVNGFVSVVDREQRKETVVINTGVRNRANPGKALAPTAAVLAENESKLYVTTGNDEGILVIDPKTRQLINQIDLDLQSPFFGEGIDAVRVGDLLYVTRATSVGSFLTAINTRTDRTMLNVSLPVFGKMLAASPSGRRIFLTGGAVESLDLLIDASDLRELARFGAPIVTTFSSAGVSFHPDGTRVYVIDSDNDVDVFLNRE